MFVILSIIMKSFGIFYRAVSIAIFCFIYTQAYSSEIVFSTDGSAHIATDVRKLISGQGLSDNAGRDIGIGVVELDNIDPLVCNLSPKRVGIDRFIIKPQSVGQHVDNVYHGNHVVSIIKQIAQSSTIYPYNLTSSGNIIQPLRAAVNNDRVQILNLSIGWLDTSIHLPGTQLFNVLADATKKGKIIVKSLGNKHNKFASQAAERDYMNSLMTMAEHPAMNGLMVLVANSHYYDLKQFMNNNNGRVEELNDSSNRPHRQCNAVITAPGTNILGNVTPSEHMILSGTSMAAPVVSGVLAALIACFPKIEKSVILREVLQSARKTNFVDRARQLGMEFGAGVVDYVSAYQSVAIIANKLAIAAAGLPADFNPRQYISIYKDLGDYIRLNRVPDEQINNWAISHYVNNGKKEGRVYIALDLPVGFTPDIYVALNPDLQDYANKHPAEIASVGGINKWAINHYIACGKNEKRIFSIDPAIYVALNADLQDYANKHPAEIASVGGINKWAINHYLTYGKNEKRTFSLDPALYVALNPDLQNHANRHPAEIASVGGINKWAINHYLTHGKNEGRAYRQPST